MKKWLVTSFCTATLFATSFTAADAASLNKEVKSESNPQCIEMIKGDNYHALALKIKESTNKQVEKEVAPEVKTPQAPAKETATPVTNNNTQAPSNSNSQQVEAPATTPSTNASQSVSEFEQRVVDLTNAERAKAGLAPLEIHEPLMAVAEAKSADMAKNNYFDHNSPTYGSPFDQIQAAGIDYRSAGENIAQGQQTPEEVVQAWMNSEGHRANILNGSYTHIGVGFVENGNYWTQQFIQL